VAAALSHAFSPRELVFFAQHFPDFFGRVSEGDGDLVVAALEQAFSFEVDQAVFSGPQQNADQFVADVDVNVEQPTKLDHGHVTLLLPLLFSNNRGFDSVFFDDAAELDNLP